jgi:hypothetical protein
VKPPAREGDWPGPVRARIPDHPEASYASAMAGIPRLSQPLWIPIGVPSARQEVFIGPNGDWGMWWPSLNTEGRDSARCPLREKNIPRHGRDQPGLYTRLDAREDPQFDGKDRQDLKRSLDEDRLPIVHVEWHHGPIRYHQSMFATILLGDIGDDQARRGDETVIFLAKIEVTNTADEPQEATLHLRYSHDAGLSLERDGMIAIAAPDATGIPPGLTAVRGQLVMDDAAGGELSEWGVDEKTHGQLRWQARLGPGETRTLGFKVPYVDLLDAAELQRLKEMRYEEEVPRVLAYWRDRMAAGMRIVTPVLALNQFCDANLWHNLITTDRDPDTGLYNQFVGTWGYKVFANETVMIARSMDMRGEHAEAERFLEPMLHYQGHEPLTGRFSTKEGVFHSAGEYTHGQYAMNHGFVMWGIADHYLFTRDRAYLERVAPKLIKACDFLISERQSTMSRAGERKSSVHGLAPASALEDIVELKYWFATNSYFHLGLKRVGQALRDVGHPEGDRIAAEAERYRRDIERALREATTRAAAVRLRDGSYVPFVPSHAFEWRHLSGGWVRDALYCSLHAATGEVVSPDDLLMTWMLDELEDNVFFSRESGYGLKDVDRYWFERGAVTKQPCLLDTPIVYMARDEIPAALRSFWNSYALLIFPDVQALAEWATQYGRPGGPMYKTADESRFVMWLRQLLVWEHGDRLWLARSVPREWLSDGQAVRVERAPTYFGEVGFSIRSEAGQGRILATVELPTRNPPAEVWLRLRHPQAKPFARVLINGEPLSPDHVVGEEILLTTGSSTQHGSIAVRAEYEPLGSGE